MKTQTKIITYLIAILMLLQPLMVTVAYATEAGETEIEVVETALLSIEVSDKALYEALKKQIGNKASYIDSENTIDIYKEDLNGITELELEDSEISDLSGIENFTELVKLDLSGNNLTTNSGLDKINSLTKLTYLDLSRNQIEDVSQISSLLNKNDFNLDIDQDIKIIDFVSIIPQPEEYEDAEDILINDLKETIDLPQIMLAYEGMTINIEEIKADGIKIDKTKFSDYVEIKDGKIRILKRDNKQYEIKLKLIGDLPNHGTTCQIKAFRIDTENQEGIVFKDENLYKAIKEKYEFALGIKTSDFSHENYTEWYDYEFVSGSENEWVFDDENLIIIANKKELRKIETLTVTSKAISNLTGIEKFVGVKTLSFENNMIIDVSKIIELNENKKQTTEEFKQKFNAYVEKLSTLVNEYTSLKTQIEAIDKEIEELRKAIANGQEITDKETTEEKEIRKEKLEISQNEKLVKIEQILAKIEEISNLDGTSGISLLLTGPSIRKEIAEMYKKCLENLQTSNVLEQKELIENNKIVDFANRINGILDNLTEKEIVELTKVSLDGRAVITDEQRLKAEAKYAIEYMKKHIDQTLDNLVDDLIDDINELTGSEITELNNEGKPKDAATIRNELKNALNRYYDSKNGISAQDVVDTCLDMTGIEESKLLIEVKDSIIPIIKENILEYANDVSEEIIEDLKSNIKDYIFDLDKMGEENKKIIERKLAMTYVRLNNILDKIEGALETEDYLSNPDDLIRIINRLQNVTDEDIKEVIKLADLTTVGLDRNLISDADKLSEIETLKVLELSNNYISNFGFDKFQNIEKLYLGHNSIKNPEITGMENIKVLDLSYNWIDDTSKMNLSGMPKLHAFYLNYNKIDDIEHLMNSKNEYIESLEYKNLGEYWQDGNTDITMASQNIILNLKVNTDKTAEEVNLPKIFSQMKELETSNLTVMYDWEAPCLNVYNDGTKVKLDTSVRNVNNKAVVYMTAGALGYFTCEINYIVLDDEIEPTISAVAGLSETFTNGEVTITIEGAADEGAGLDARPYSFDNGVTWQVANSKTFTENTENIIIKVKDLEGNVYTHEPINITNIDKTAPVVSVDTSVVDTESGKSSVTITITEEQSGLNDDENKYEYCLSTSKEEANGTWTEFVSGTAFEVGQDLEGTYYMFVKEVSDKVGNVSEAVEPVEFIFVIPDTTNPTITGVTGNPENWINEDVTLTIEGADDETALDDEPYSFDGGNSWQKSNTKTYTQNTENIEILVRDAAGNVYTHEKVNISKIDKTAPVINVKKENTENGEVLITVSAEDKESGLSQDNEYEYRGIYCDEEGKEMAGHNWIEFKLDEAIQFIKLNTEVEKLYDHYILIKNVKDAAGNEATISPIEIKFEDKTQTEEENGTLEYLTLPGITKLIRAYITDDYSTLPESYMVIAGEDGEFEITEITRAIRLFISL